MDLFRSSTGFFTVRVHEFHENYEIFMKFVSARINEFLSFLGSDGKNSFSTSVQVQKLIGKCVNFFFFFFSEIV